MNWKGAQQFHFYKHLKLGIQIHVIYLFHFTGFLHKIELAMNYNLLPR